MLQVDDLNLYYGASHTLRNVSLTARKGEISCLLGRNGVGKSSFLRALVGIESIRSGRIVWEDHDITDLPPHRRAQRGVGYVPQGREIFPMLTVAENLQTGMAPLPRSERYIPDEIFDMFPVLKSMLKRRGGDLSGGQQQQLAIGRALVTRPRLLILDEPTEGIQPSIIKEIERVIRLLAERGDMAVLLVEQYYEFARDLATELAVMVRGEIMLSGPVDGIPEHDVRRHLTV
jgi:urea transport system ATP-binding protein